MPARLLTRELEQLRSSLRGRNLVLHVFEMWVGLAGIVAGIVFFYSPASINHSAITQTIGYHAAAVWTIGYMIAGLLIWFGLLWPSPLWEVVGLWLLGSATAMNGIAVIAVFGLRGTATVSILLTLTAASWLRALIVQADTLKLANECQGVKGETGGVP